MNKKLKQKIENIELGKHAPFDVFFSEEREMNISEKNQSKQVERTGLEIEEFNVKNCVVMVSLRPTSKMINPNLLLKRNL